MRGGCQRKLLGVCRDKTLKRSSNKKSFSSSAQKYELHKYAKTTLGILDLREAVQLPEETMLNDWLAVHGVYLRLLRARLISPEQRKTSLTKS